MPPPDNCGEDYTEECGQYYGDIVDELEGLGYPEELAPCDSCEAQRTAMVTAKEWANTYWSIAYSHCSSGIQVFLNQCADDTAAAVASNASAVTAINAYNACVRSKCPTEELALLPLLLVGFRRPERRRRSRRKGKPGGKDVTDAIDPPDEFGVRAPRSW
jgi:hypothetical protein